MKDLNKFVMIICWLIMLTLTGACQQFIEDSLQPLEKNTIIQNHKSYNNVTYSNIVALHRWECESTRSNIDIKCVVDEDNDTLLYVYNKPDGGWIMYASDSRIPAIIAESGNRSFSEVLSNENAKFWIKGIAGDIKTIKKSTDEELNFSSKEIECHRDFWKTVSLLEDYKSKGFNTRSGDSLLILPDTIFISGGRPGHYELREVKNIIENFDSIPRLTTTDWHQDFPYNYYCPYKSFSKYERAPAGCVAIAGAQMLYFLHNKYGVPTTAPSQAYCNGNVNSSDYDWNQFNYTTDIWEKMKYNGIYAAPLIADVGRRVNMKYGDNGSNADGKDLVSQVFKPYGLNTTHCDYDSNILKEKLLDGLPVLLIAYSQDPDTGKYDGHDFIADRYKRTRIKL